MAFPHLDFPLLTHNAKTNTARIYRTACTRSIATSWMPTNLHISGPDQYWRFTGRGLTKSNIVIRPWPGVASLMKVYCGDATKQAKIYLVDSWKGIYLKPCQHFLYPEACFRGCAGSRGNLPRDLRETRNKAWPGQRKTVSIQLNGS